MKQPLSKERVVKQLRKTGTTVFEIRELSLEMADDIFMPVQALNELRRGALASLEQEILKKIFRETFRSMNDSVQTVKPSHKGGRSAGLGFGGNEGADKRPCWVRVQ